MIVLSGRNFIKMLNSNVSSI